MEDQLKLPDGWRWVRLGEVCEIIMGQSPAGASYNSGGRGVLLLNGPTEFGATHPTPVQWTTEPTRLARQGDFLFCVRGATTGRMNVADQAYCIGRGLAAIRDKDGHVDMGFLPYLLRRATQDILKETAGSTFPNLPGEKLERFPVALPLLAEQRRIAAILNEQMGAVERARAAGEAQLEAAKALPAAYLRAVFSSPEAQRWHTTRLADVGNIVSGITLGRKLSGADTRRVPYLRVANVKDGFLDLSDVYNIEATETEITKCMLKQGDLLLTEGGDPDKLGRGSFWQGQMPECIHQNHIFRVRFDLTTVSPQFMSAQMASTYGKAYFLAHAKQTTGIATVNQKVLGNFPLLMPPLDTQQHIAAALNEQMASAERARKAIEEELDAINKLPAALLRRAFAGES